MTTGAGGQQQQQVLFLSPPGEGEQQTGVWGSGVRAMALCLGLGRSEGLVWGFLMEGTFP